MMLRAFFALSLIAFSGLLMGEESPGAEEILVDRVLAVVNGEAILKSEVEDKVRNGFIAISYYPAQDDDSDFEKALQDSVNFELILQKAREMDIEVGDAEVEKEVSTLLERRGQSREMLLGALKQAGISFEDYKSDFKDQIILRQFQSAVIRPMVKITDRDLENYYQKKTGGKTADVSLRLRQILFAVPQGAAAEIVEAKQSLATTVHQRLTAGSPFVESVKLYSDQPGAREHEGLMSDVRLNDLSELIRNAVGDLNEGEFSEPVRSPLGFHIFQVEAKKFAGASGFEKAKQQLENELFMIEGENQTRKWLMDYRRRNEIRVIEE